MSALPSAIAIIETPGGEVRYCLPRPPIGPIRVFALLPLAIGALITGWPIFGIMFFLSGPGPQWKGEMLWISVLLPLLLFGPICFPFGGYLLFMGLHMIAGHTEIALRAGRLYIIDRCGPLHWTRRRPLNKLRGFRLEHDQWANLKADVENGKSLTVCRCYPREWLLPLAQELAHRCERVAQRQTGSAEQIPVDEICTDRALIQDRPRQPTNSTAIVEPQADGLTITIPPPGLLRGNNWFFVVLCLFWNGIMLPCMLLSLTPELLDLAKREGMMSALFKCLLLSPFVLIGIACLMGQLHRGRRRALISVAGRTLQVVEIGPFGTQRHQWAVTELIDVRVLYESHKDGEGGILWTIALAVQTKNGKTYRLLPHRRDKAELEWVATVVRQALRLRQATTQPAPAPP